MNSKQPGPPDLAIHARNKETKEYLTETYTRRDGEQGKARLAILVAWLGPYGPNWSLAKGWKLVGPNGEVLTTGREGTHYLSQSDERERREARRHGDTGAGDGYEPIPF